NTLAVDGDDFDKGPDAGVAATLAVVDRVLSLVVTEAVDPTRVRAPGGPPDGTGRAWGAAPATASDLGD
ncbi:hypothetical protein ABTB76_19795, partial [Acinetobacter baumannii]